jgi:predicted acylesterase/phospholipase RssA
VLEFAAVVLSTRPPSSGSIMPDLQNGPTDTTLDVPSKLRLGLVLGGGGGKGAYQVGVYRFLAEFLAELGVKRFHCISGTSIGALNGLLFSVANAHQASEMWESMANVLKTTLRSQLVKSAVIWTLLLTFVPIAALALSILTYRLSHRLPSLILAGFMFALFVIGSFSVAPDLGLVFYILDIKKATRLSSQRVETLLATLALSVLGCLWLFSANIWPFRPEPIYNEQGWIGLPRLAVNISVWTVLLVIAYRVWAPIQKHRQKLIKFTTTTGYYDQQPLRTVLVELLSISSDRWRTEFLFATVGRKGTYFDPDRNASIYGEPVSPDPYGKWVNDEWVPEYKNLGALPITEKLKALLLSSAIPYAFSNTSGADGIRCDGGFVDNVPILPCIAQAHCNVIVVVPLDAEYDRKMALLDLEKLWWKTEIVARAPDDDLFPDQLFEIASDLRASKYREEVQKRNPTNKINEIGFVYVVPHASLGEGLDATLDFTPPTMSRLQKMGYEDAKSQIPRQFQSAIKKIALASE